MEAAIANFDSLDKFARMMTPDGYGLGFSENVESVDGCCNLP
jgi:hypothetical protein